LALLRPQEILVVPCFPTREKMKLQNHISSQWLQRLQQHCVSFLQCHLVRKICTLWFFLEGSDEEVEKAEITEKTMKSCGSSETPLAFIPNPFIIL